MGRKYVVYIFIWDFVGTMTCRSQFKSDFSKPKKKLPGNSTKVNVTKITY